jgi:hypothetical protein
LYALPLSINFYFCPAKKSVLKKLSLIIACLICTAAFAEDTCYIKVHFLYGSKPLKQYKQSQRKWFGGVLGGHVGIEGDTNKILNFSPSGKFHVFNENKNKHSHYSLHTPNEFYRVLSHNDDSMKKVIVHIPVTKKQKQIFDSLSNSYLKQTPYDYALFGMRCGAASYEILAQLNILPAFSYTKTYTKIFYPKKLRLRLLKKAEQEGWTIEKYNGTSQRRWEQD